MTEDDHPTARSAPSSEALAGLACPCGQSGSLALEEKNYLCRTPGCGKRFPVVDGVPVLIDEDRSIFRHESYIRHEDTTMAGMATGPRRENPLKAGARWLLNQVPSRSSNAASYTAGDALEAVLDRRARPRVLVLGCGDVRLKPSRPVDLVYSDVTLGPLAMLIADAHDIPFANAQFDFVIAAAVLEHVADPQRVVAEIHRVLKPDGFVYAVTPFMQQVHLGRYDFTRFTFVGHRRLFRMFDDLAMGIAGGPGMALAWAFNYYLTSFAEGPRMRSLLDSLSRLLVAPFKYADGYLVRKKGAYDGASAFYFFGQRRETALDDRAILACHRGLNSV